VLDPDGIEDGPVICPVRFLTGLPCPGCGLTRSWVYLAHGHWAEAWAAHPFVILSMLAVITFVAVVAVRAMRRTPLPDVGRLLSSRLVISFGAAWIAYGGWRLLSQPTGRLKNGIAPISGLIAVCIPSPAWDAQV
jgi:hypothetical protein